MRAKSWIVPALSSFYFLIAGLALIPWPGLQNDELFFAGPLYERDTAAYNAHIGSLRIPTMLMSYMGALKTWLYAGLLKVVTPSVWTIRFPVVLIGAITIWLTWMWMRRIGAGPWATAIAVALLATDTSYLLTTTFDWGPVALQHLLLMGGLVTFQSWVNGESRVRLALAFFLWGLGLWDKALMIWPLSGLALACVVVYWGEVKRRMRFVPAIIALGSLLAGASPLIWFNIAQPGATFSRNVSLSHADFAPKLRALRESVDGSSMFGYMVYRDRASRRTPDETSPAFPQIVKRSLGSHERNWMPAGLALALVCFLLSWGSPAWRFMLFLGMAITVSWCEMVWNRGTGTSVHHVVLLWPFPFVFTGTALATAMDRFPGAARAGIITVTCCLMAGNLLTTNEYLADFIDNGGQGGWTDAIYPLAESVDRMHPAWVGLVDWGCLNDLLVLHKVKMGFFEVDDSVINSPPTFGGLLFVQHVQDKEIFPGINGKFRQAVLRKGFTEHVEQVIKDKEGRPVFELFTLQSSPARDQ